MTRTLYACPLHLVVVVVGLIFSATLPAQQIPEVLTTDIVSPSISDQVAVSEIATDEAIASRLNGIMQATGWFTDVAVEVESGIVFLSGEAAEDANREWAERLANNTQDVVAVVNRMTVRVSSTWDLSPVWNELKQIGMAAIRVAPMVLLGAFLLLVTWIVTRISVRGARNVLGRQFNSPLLRDVAARAVSVPVFLIGLYLVLQVSGLTGLATTVIGGTGLIGLIVGFAFRDIAENFLSSVLLSIQHPFAVDDLIEVAGYTGYVQNVNTRSTLLMTRDGNHVQIPNSTIYKSTIVNLTANPNSRFDFAVGIGYDDSISHAQTIILSVLQAHEAVLDEPEPVVLVEALGAATVNLKIYFWVNVANHSQFKVRSAIIRLVKRALDDAGISMPDEAREVVFPQGVPVEIDKESFPRQSRQIPSSADESEQQSEIAEGGLVSDTQEILRQARRARRPEGDINLLEPD